MAIFSFDIFARRIADYMNVYEQSVLCLDAAATTTEIGRITSTSCTLTARMRLKSTSFSGDNLEISKIMGHTQWQIHNQCSFIPHEFTVMFV